MKELKAVFLLLTCYCLSYAQTGTITGNILDKETNEPLIGATVIIDSTSIGTVTDFDGNYQISGIKPGVVKVKFSYLGYETRLVENVLVEANKQTTLNIILSPEGGLLEEFEVVDFAITNTESAVVMELKRTNQIANGISSQQISKTLDRDAAQVVKRIPGITISGNFINIRGLNQRYNNVMLQNITAPSMEPDVRSFAFDIIPSSQLDRLLVLKSPSADLPGDFAGGMVKIYTKSLPDSNFYSFSYSTGFRAGTTFKDFNIQPTGKSFFAGFDNHYQLPSGFPDNLSNIADNTERENISRSVSNDWVAENHLAMPDQRIGFVKGTRIRTKNGLIGNITALNYGITQSYFNVDRADYGAYNVEKDTSSPQYNYTDQQYNRQARLGAIHNWTFKINSHNLVEFRNLFNATSNAQYIFRTGHDYASDYFPNNASFDQVYRGIYNGQLSGKHDVNERSTIEWTAGYGRSYRKEPDYRRYRSALDTATGNTTLYISNTQVSSNIFGKFYSDMKENTYNAQANYTVKLGNADKSKKLYTLASGFYMEYKSRDFSARNLGYIKGNTGTFDNALVDSGVAVLFQPEHINSTTGIVLDELSDPSDSYTADNLLASVFVNAEIPLTEKLRLITGVRYEFNNQQLHSADDKGALEVKNPTHNILPSLNLRYDISSKMLVRTAYGMSTNRPEFREIAPFGFYDFNTSSVMVGNINLQNCTIHNLDLKWEYYPSSKEMINVAFFYKRFINPIEVVTIIGGDRTFSFANAASANDFGMELELKKNFESAPSKFLQNLGIMFNGSYINSKISLGNIGVGQSDNRPMQGQAPYVVNAGIFYNDAAHGYQVNINYNIVGQKIAFVGAEDYPDIYEMPRHSLDVSLSYLFKKGVELTAGAADIINQKVQYLQDGNQDGKLQKDKDQVIMSYKPGTQFSLGVKYTF